MYLVWACTMFKRNTAVKDKQGRKYDQYIFTAKNINYLYFVNHRIQGCSKKHISGLASNPIFKKKIL